MTEDLGDLKHKIRNDIEVFIGIELELRSLLASTGNPGIILIMLDRCDKFKDRLIERISDVETLIEKSED
jgi:hypothetical protein